VNLQLKYDCTVKKRHPSKGYFLFVLETVFHRAVAAPHIDVVALLGRRAHTARVGRIGGITALRLGLVVPEDEEGIGTGLELRAEHRLIRGRVAPRADAVVRRQTDVVESTDGLVGLARVGRILEEIVREPLGTTTGVTIHHYDVGEQQEQQTRDQERGLHSVSV
jgi:hypothetical protein